MTRPGVNRPFKFGERDRREFIVQESEVTFRAINDLSGNPIFLGRAKIGVSESEEKWQIRKITYDTANGITKIEWPTNSVPVISGDYEFIWDSGVTPLTITGISKANPAVVTVSSIGALSNGDKVYIADVVGMTEVNFDGDNLYTVANIAGNTFELSGIDSSAFTAYTSGGTVYAPNVLQYTYA